MSAQNIVDFPGAPPIPGSRRRANKPPRPPRPLPLEATQAIRMLNFALEALDEGTPAGQRRVRVFIDSAIGNLENAIEARREEAQRDLADDLLRALGPDVTYGEVQGARAAFGLMFTALGGEFGPGDAA